MCFHMFSYVFTNVCVTVCMCVVWLYLCLCVCLSCRLCLFGDYYLLFVCMCVYLDVFAAGVVCI